MKNEIGERIKIKEGLYEVVKPDRNAQKFIASSAIMGFYITSFRMDFIEQEAVIVGEGRAMLADGVVIEYEIPKTTKTKNQF